MPSNTKKKEREREFFNHHVKSPFPFFALYSKCTIHHIQIRRSYRQNYRQKFECDNSRAVLFQIRGNLNNSDMSAVSVGAVRRTNPRQIINDPFAPFRCCGSETTPPGIQTRV